MKKLLLFSGLILFSVVAAALPQAPKAKPSVDVQLKIVKIQKHIADLQIRANAAQSALAAASQDYAQSSKDLADLVDQAYSNAGLKKEEYDLNPDTLEFTKKAAPEPTAPAPAAAPNTKKP